ncbi:MAG TPA: hypothetical protein VIP09_10925 [Dehalococcoidia bacterium]
MPPEPDPADERGDQHDQNADQKELGDEDCQAGECQQTQNREDDEKQRYLSSP